MAGSKTIPGFHVILLAGGSGTRFWPLSRARRPKQLLPLAGKDPLLLATWKRVRKLSPPSRIWVAAPAALREQVQEVLPGLREENLIPEPSPRDTAPAIALACHCVARRDPEAVVGIFPTDHVIPDAAAFGRSVREAVAAANRGSLVCMGVRPDRPSTGFGYLKCAALPRGTRAVKVDRFVEKPDAARARRFLKSGRYLWNGGMFVWKVSRFLQELDRAEPGIGKAVRGHLEGKRGAWNRATRLSVDYAVMEKARDVAVVPLDAGWDDVGSWAAAARLQESSGRRQGGSQVLVDSEGSVVFAGDRMIALVGLPGVVVVDTPDALLVVSRDRAESVKEVVGRLKRTGRKDLL